MAVSNKAVVCLLVFAVFVFAVAGQQTDAAAKNNWPDLKALPLDWTYNIDVLSPCSINSVSVPHPKDPRAPAGTGTAVGAGADAAAEACDAALEAAETNLIAHLTMLGQRGCRRGRKLDAREQLPCKAIRNNLDSTMFVCTCGRPVVTPATPGTEATTTVTASCVLKNRITFLCDP